MWVQIEAQPNLTDATDRARVYAADLPDVNGFRMGSGWYAIALGPYARSDADQVLRVHEGHLEDATAEFKRPDEFKKLVRAGA